MAWFQPMRIAAWLALTAVLTWPLDGVAAPCAPRATAEKQVVDVLRQGFAALRNDDLAAWSRETTADFYAFDGGLRFDRLGLFGVIKEAHAARKVFVWTVTEPDSHVRCDWAWVAYTNRGSVRDAEGEPVPVTWLESAVLRYEGGRWRLAFLHSTRMK